MKPILFNTGMVRAILDGRKTVTRRVVKPQPVSVQGKRIELQAGVDFLWLWNEGAKDEYTKSPFNPGDILYVRETWAEWSNGMVAYKANVDRGVKYYDQAHNEIIFKWRPSIHMPSEAARIFLRVTGVRVERLQDITDDGIHAEGVQSKKPEWLRLDFADLWHVSLGPKDPAVYGWNANPWVWVIEFEQIRKEEAVPC